MAFDPDEPRDEHGRWGSGGGAATPEEANAQAVRVAAGAKPLEGLPQKPIQLGDKFYTPGPIGYLRDAATAYMKSAGLPYTPVTDYHKLDEGQAARIAKAYDEMKHDPNDPAVKASYAALTKEVIGQYKALTDSGVKVEWIKPGQADPYAKSPRMAAMDVSEHKHWYGFPTDQGYGTNDKTSHTDNPMLQPSGIKIDGRDTVVNDVFRVVHDMYGHMKEGNGFRAGGEDNAWRSHAAMFSAAALPAMTAETRGQNSWVNYGPHGETNRKASAGDTIYAPQKIGIMPKWTQDR
jgi:hypothetical protein